MKSKKTTYKIHRVLAGPVENEWGHFSLLVSAETSEFMGLIEFELSCDDKEGVEEVIRHLEVGIDPYVVEIEEPDEYYIYPH